VASTKAGDFGATQQPGGGLPPDSHPTALLKCDLDTEDVTGQGQWLVVKTVRSTGSVDGFVDVLRAAYVKPAQPTPKGDVACADVAYVQPWLVLADADGHAYRISVPMWGVCPAPDPDVMKALAALPMTTVTTDRIRQTTSAGAQASGCSQQYADMAFVNVTSDGNGASGSYVPFPGPGTTLAVCYYKISGSYDRVKPAGDFDGTATITGAQAAAVHQDLLNSPLATIKTCAAPASEYAVIHDTLAGGDWSVVELGGCGLVAPSSGADRQASAPLVQALLAAKK
jgi:hypothetical protein